jgi:ribosomal protein S21
VSGRSRTSFDKLQKERKRQEKQAEKRARRHGTTTDQRPPEPGDEKSSRE